MKRILLILLIFSASWTPARSAESVEFFSGFLRADLPEDGAIYEAVPFLVSFNFEASAFIKKLDSPLLKLSVN